MAEEDGSVGGREVSIGAGESMMGALALVVMLVALGDRGDCAADRFIPMNITIALSAMMPSAIIPAAMNIQTGKRRGCSFLESFISDLSCVSRTWNGLG